MRHVKIFVMNRAEAVDFCDDPGVSGSYAMVSIGTPSYAYDAWPHKSDTVKALLLLQFYDVGCRDAQETQPITDASAETLADFIHACHHEGLNFIVHCDAGISRSAGVAMAIQDYFKSIGVQVQVQSNRRMYPNTDIYAPVRAKLGEREPGPDEFISKLRLLPGNRLHPEAAQYLEGWPVVYQYTQPDSFGKFLVGGNPGRPYGPAFDVSWDDVEPVSG